MIDKLNVYGIQFKKLGLATFGVGGGEGEVSLLSGFTSGHKKFTLISWGGGATFGRSLLSELYGSFLIPLQAILLINANVPFDLDIGIFLCCNFIISNISFKMKLTLIIHLRSP